MPIIPEEPGCVHPQALAHIRSILASRMELLAYWLQDHLHDTAVLVDGGQLVLVHQMYDGRENDPTAYTLNVAKAFGITLLPKKGWKTYSNSALAALNPLFASEAYEAYLGDKIEDDEIIEEDDMHWRLRRFEVAPTLGGLKEATEAPGVKHVCGVGGSLDEAGAAVQALLA